MASRIDKLSKGETSALRQEAISFANQIAKNARLDNPLPTDVDFSPEVFEELQSQLKASAVLPVKARRAIYLAFSAAHLPTLAAGLRALSYETQHKALSSYVQILSLLPDPKENAYFRRFLDQPISDGLPTLIASFFVRGLEYLPPSSRGQICTLIIHTLFWCDVRKGDDKATSIDRQARSDLTAKLKELMEEDSYTALDRRSIESVELGRLSGMLTQIEHLPGPNGPGDGYFCSSTKEHLLGTIPGQEECDQCMEEEDLQTCSRCKAVKYCSEKCQRKAWKEHKLTCFTVAF